MNDNEYLGDGHVQDEPNELEYATIGDIFVDRSGNEWVVQGFYEQPTVMLSRVDMLDVLPFDRPVNDVIPSSRWAQNWRVAYHKSGVPKQFGDQPEE